MSNLSYSLIDDDQIDDQETMINVGNLIIDLESDLEKEKIENEQAIAKPTSATTNPNPSSSTYAPKASSSSNSSSINASAKHHRTSSKHSNNTTNSNNDKIGLQDSKSLINNKSNTLLTNNNGNSNTINNNGHAASNKTLFKSLSDERGELKMRITREMKPGKSEHKIVTSPSHNKSPTSSCSNNTAPNHQIISDCHYESTNKISTGSSISSTKECGTSTSIGTITEPECLGPCEPGTSVNLEGIVWQETDGGILVVNVTWRGKTYVGALLDCTKHDWAPPRLCDSPASDIDSKQHKSVRTKRIVTRSNGVGFDEKTLQTTTGKLRNGKGRRILPANDLAPCNKRQKDSEKPNNATASEATNVSTITNSETASGGVNEDTTLVTESPSISTSNIFPDKAGPVSPMLIGCGEPNCSKKYRNANGLLYHQTHAHGTDNETGNTQDNNCSSSSREKITTICDPPEQSKNISTDRGERQSPSPPMKEHQPTLDDKPYRANEVPRTPSPHLSNKASIKSNLSPNNDTLLLNHEARSKKVEIDRRDLCLNFPNINDRRSPNGPRQFPEQGQGPSNTNHHLPSKSSSTASKQQSNPAQLPSAEEGMKPSGTSTGPPPAPHQANCYFNSAFLSNAFNPYGLGPYFGRPPLPLYDSLAPPTSAANAAFLSRFMGQVRPPPPPDSPSRLMNSAVPKNLPFHPFKPDPSVLSIPTPLGNPSLPNMPPLTNPQMESGSPHLRMPSQSDPLLPANCQPPLPPPVCLNPALGLPNSTHPAMGPIGGPPVPSLIDDPLSKQFPRRLN